MGTPGVEEAVLRRRGVVIDGFPLTSIWLIAEERGDIKTKATLISLIMALEEGRWQPDAPACERWLEWYGDK